MDRLRVGGRLEVFDLLAADVHLSAQALDSVESGLHVFDFSQPLLNLFRAVSAPAPLVGRRDRSPSSSLRADGLLLRQE